MRIAALDLGDARIGVAATDELELFAHPVGVVERQGGNRDFRAIAALLGEPTPARWVVGLPLNMDDSEGPQAKKARAFAKRLQGFFDVPVDLFDERLTTFAAKSFMRETGVPAKKRRAVRDQMAAVLILEGYLDSRR